MRAASRRACWRAANSGSFVGSFCLAFSSRACLALACSSNRSVKVSWFFNACPLLLSERLLGRRGGRLFLCALAILGLEEALAQPDRFRRDLDQLVFLDIGDR